MYNFSNNLIRYLELKGFNLLLFSFASESYELIKLSDKILKRFIYYEIVIKVAINSAIKVNSFILAVKELNKVIGGLLFL